jgi:thermostable 8-oxoguanine DNA glycosylase
MQFSPTSCHFISLRSKYSPQHPVLKHHQSADSADTCSRWFLARGLFYPEDGHDKFLRNVGLHDLQDATF